MKHFVRLSLGALLLLAVAGCGSSKTPVTSNEPSGNSSAPTTVDEEKKLIPFGSPVTLTHPSYLVSETISSRPGSALLLFKKAPNKQGILDTFLFSTKTYDSWKEEMKQAVSSTTVCESEAQFGCERWDEDFALYQKALKTKTFDGYYALAGRIETINGIQYVILVTYNVDTKQYQVTYLGYSKNTRLTFVDPAAGALEYGQPFYMTAKNRSLVEDTAVNLAKREKLDEKTASRASALYAVVASAHLKE